mgnify:CR=1 FL=1
MFRQFAPYLIPLFVAAVTSLALAVYVWRRRTMPGALAFVGLALAVALWSLGYVLEIISLDLSQKIFWAKLEYLGIVSVPLAWLTFALAYTGREHWLTRRNLALLALAPLITLLLIWTNERHGLMWAEVGLASSGPFPTLAVNYGPWFWFHLAYSYVLLLWGSLLLLRMVLNFPDLYRWQAVVLVFGCLAPWLGNLIYIFELSPVPNLDLTPLAFSLTGLALGWGLFRWRFFDVVPIARRTVVDNMREGVIVLDAQNRLVDLNPAARRIIGADAGKAIGQSSTQALASWAELLEQDRAVTEGHTQLVREINGKAHNFELRLSPVYDQRQRLSGRLIVLRDITAQKQAEQALRQSEERFRQVISSISDHVYMTEFRPDGRQINHYISPNVTDLTGYPYQQFLSDWNFWPSTVIHPDDRPAAAAQASRFAAGQNSEMEYRLVRADGQIIWVRDSGRVESDPASRSRLVYGVVSDITQRRQADATLRQLSRAVEQSPNSVIITDLTGRIEFVNPAFCQTSGYAAQEALGQNPRLLKSGLHPPEFYAQMWARLSQGEVWQGELINKKKNGQLYWEAATISPIKDGQGQMTHYLAIKEDITDRKKTEHALKESEARYRTVIQAANDAVIIATLESGQIIEANARAAHLLGRPLSEIIGRPQLELFPKAKAEQYQAALNDSLTGGGGHMLPDMEVIRRDGQIIPVEISVSIIEGSQGQPLVLGLYRDISQRKRAEEALIHAFNQAVAANQLKTQLLANISHDLRTPINAILGYTEMLQEGLYGPVSVEQKAVTRRIIDNTTNLTHLVGQLLDQAQLEAGTLKLKVSSFDPAELIDRVESTLKLPAQAKGIELNCQISADLPPVLSGDPDRLYQILTNLVDNAIKFTEAGPVEVQLYCPDELHWAMRVTDSGPGIPTEAHAYIFEPFQQLDGTATRAHRGSGLGLSIVKQLTTLMAGEVILESQAGQGSTFIVKLPL